MKWNFWSALKSSFVWTVSGYLGSTTALSTSDPHSLEQRYYNIYVYGWASATTLYQIKMCGLGTQCFFLHKYISSVHVIPKFLLWSLDS